MMMKALHHLLAILILMTMTGCPAPFTRSTPDPTEYAARYLATVSTSEIVNLQYKYHGAVGGYGTIAKITVRDLASLKKQQRPTHIMGYNPTGDIAQLTKDVAKGRFTAIAGSQLPQWFDVPLDKPMDIFIWEQPDTSNRPSYSTTWYMDVEENRIFMMSAGN